MRVQASKLVSCGTKVSCQIWIISLHVDKSSHFYIPPPAFLFPPLFSFANKKETLGAISLDNHANETGDLNVLARRSEAQLETAVRGIGMIVREWDGCIIWLGDFISDIWHQMLSWCESQDLLCTCLVPLRIHLFVLNMDFYFILFYFLFHSKQHFENRNSSHEKIFCEMEQNSGFICCLEDPEDLGTKSLAFVSTCSPVNEMWGYSFFTQTIPLNSESLVIQIYS